MDDEMTTQLRTVTFSEARKGFDKEEVRKYLAEVSRWVEGGGGDVVRRRLERIANKSAQMLADAEDGAESLRREAEQEAHETLETVRAEADAYRADAENEARVQLRDARAEATSTREAANQYATETTTKADEYADQTRLEAKRESDELLEEASHQAKQTVRSAQQRAEQLLAEANRQRAAIETVIGDLVQERDAVVANVRKLARSLEETASDVASEVVPKRSVVAAEEIEFPEPEPIEPRELEEDLGAESAPVRRRNGSPAI